MQPGRGLLDEAFRHYQRGDLGAAERILSGMADNASALHLLGVMRVRQGRLPEAADLLGRSVTLQPSEAQAQLNLGKVLNTLGRYSDASKALQAALSLDSSINDAALLLGKSLHAQMRLDEAVAAYRSFLAVKPDHAPAKIALANAFFEMEKLDEAEALLSEALRDATDPNLRATIHMAFVTVFRDSRPAAALHHLEEAQALDPGRTDLDADRAMLLEEAHRFADAKAIYQKILDRNPVDAKAHHDYNELLYRLGSDEEFLASYQNAPRTQELMLAKAGFLLTSNRLEEAKTCYQDALTRYSDNKTALLGLGLALARQGKFSDAVEILERAVKAYPDSVDALCNLAAVLAQRGEPQRAVSKVRRALAIEPENQVALAMLGTSFRLMDDLRDEELNGYDEFIQVFDLEPPEGCADMKSFNVELGAYLDSMHPPVREYPRQSLRGGTQTRNNLFDAGHLLVDKLRSRVVEAVGRYIGSLKPNESHPFLSRIQTDFQFAGSWSSKLRNNGFHINHLHPGGWISSCYYVELPPAVKDETERQGWIKFGEPSFEVGLGARRAIQPAVGRLVLFPSYMWHGTIPFHDNNPRTTIAFDVVPKHAIDS